jgi:hypothetical protein
MFFLVYAINYAAYMYPLPIQFAPLHTSQIIQAKNQQNYLERAQLQ